MVIDIICIVVIAVYIVVDIAQIKNRNKHMKLLNELEKTAIEEIALYKEINGKLDTVIARVKIVSRKDE